MEPLALQTPSTDHVQFDQMCAEVDEFEPLPAMPAGPAEQDEETGLDEQILAALVSPQY